MLGKQIDGKSDVYSFGLCVWELFSCQEPYSAFTNFNDFRRAVCFKQERPDMVPAPLCPEIVQKLIRDCWDNEPKNRPTFAEIIDYFPTIFLDCMVADKAGKQFWNDSFHKDGQFPLEVGWDVFAATFAKYLKMPATAPSDTGFLCLKTLIAQKSSHPGGDPFVVSVERFGHYLTQFGPLAPGKSDVVDRLEELAMYKPKRKHAAHVFHGNISSQEAEKLLAGQEKGSWLVRVSTKDAKQPFVISKMSRQGAINHQRINYDAETRTYKLEIRLKDRVKTAESEPNGSLVEFLKSLREDLYLKAACAGSPYAAVFTQATVQGYLVSNFDN